MYNREHARWGCSSVWLERLPVTQKVEGSSPFTPATIFRSPVRGFFLYPTTLHRSIRNIGIVPSWILFYIDKKGIAYDTQSLKLNQITLFISTIFAITFATFLATTFAICPTIAFTFVSSTITSICNNRTAQYQRSNKKIYLLHVFPFFIVKYNTPLPSKIVVN